MRRETGFLINPDSLALLLTRLCEDCQVSSLNSNFLFSSTARTIMTKKSTEMQASMSTKYQPYSLRRGMSQEQTKKRTEKQISFTSAIETLAILSPAIDAENRDPFSSFGASSSVMTKVSKNQSKFSPQMKIQPVDPAAELQEYLINTLPSPTQDTTVCETIPAPVEAFVENAVNSKAQCTVSHETDSTSAWGGSVGSLRITADHVLSNWRLLSSDLTIAYIFADESSGSVKYVVHNGEGNDLLLIPESSLSSFPAPESMDIDEALISNDPRVFFLDPQGGSNIQGFLIPSSSWSDKSLSVKLDGTAVTLAAHDDATADEWVISTVNDWLPQNAARTWNVADVKKCAQKDNTLMWCESGCNAKAFTWLTLLLIDAGCQHLILSKLLANRLKQWFLPGGAIFCLKIPGGWAHYKFFVRVFMTVLSI